MEVCKCGKSRSVMGQTTSTASPAPSSSLDTQQAKCPIQHSSPPPPSQTSSSKCPIDHNALAPNSPLSASGSGSSPHPSGGPARCPIDHGTSETLNPLNQMPTLAQERAPGQTADLPLDRETSSIPRASDSSKWEYPSAQQFYNALVRKGWETPEEHVQTMVDIHNFLNEEAWQEILKWEPLSVFLSLFPLLQARRPNFHVYYVRDSEPFLAKFKGKPGQLSPKARLLMFAGWLLPSRFKRVSIHFLYSFRSQFPNISILFSIAPRHHLTDTIGSSTGKKRAKKSDTSSTITPPPLFPTAAPYSVSTFDPLSIVSRGFKLVSMAGRISGQMRRLGKTMLELQPSNPATFPLLSVSLHVFLSSLVYSPHPWHCLSH